MEKKIKVHVCIPSFDGKPMAEVMLSIMNQELPEGVELEFSRSQILDGLPIQLARNQLFFNFLRKSTADYLRFIDDDNRCDNTTLKYMLEHKVDAISAIVPLRYGPLRYCVVRDGKPITSFEGLGGPLVEVENIGTGCCLLSRKLCEDMWKFTEGHPYRFVVGDFTINEETQKIEEYHGPELHKGYKKITKDGKDIRVEDQTITNNLRKRMIGEDLWFGEQAKKLGYKFYTDLRCLCKHAVRKTDPRRVSSEDFIISQSFIPKDVDDEEPTADDIFGVIEVTEGGVAGD